MRDFTLNDVARGIQGQHPEISPLVLKAILKKAFNKILRVMSKGNPAEAFSFKQCDLTWVFNGTLQQEAIKHIFDLDETQMPNSYQLAQFRENRRNEKKKVRLPVWYSGITKEVCDTGYIGPDIHSREHLSAGDESVHPGQDQEST